MGKYAGLLLTLAVNTAFMTLGLAAAFFYVGGRIVRADVAILVAIYFILLELALVTALAHVFLLLLQPDAVHAVHSGHLLHRRIRGGYSRHR